MISSETFPLPPLQEELKKNHGVYYHGLSYIFLVTAYAHSKIALVQISLRPLIGCVKLGKAFYLSLRFCVANPLVRGNNYTFFSLGF